MKNKILWITSVLVLVCTACINSNTVHEKTAQDNMEQVHVVTGTVQSDDEKNGEQQLKLNIYHPDEMVETVMIEEVVINGKMTEELLWNLLKDKNVIKKECEINSFTQEGTLLKMDVNEAFGIQLRLLGTSGESVLLNSVVNTYLDAYQCEKISITENGGILYSEHAAYAEPFEKNE